MANTESKTSQFIEITGLTKTEAVQFLEVGNLFSLVHFLPKVLDDNFTGFPRRLSCQCLSTSDGCTSKIYCSGELI